jgi:carbonic anhydrase/acetyltransferase-like protein (isoleucine patch superfamily)
MGATVRAGAIVRAGAVVSWGATVGKGAVVERNAVVSWGATVRNGAVVGEGSVVSWGATVGKNAQMPAGTSLRAGATWSGRGQLPAVAVAALPANAPSGAVPASAALPASGAIASPAAIAAPAPIDPRQQRLDAVCARLEAELRDAPEQQRQMFGARAETIAALRKTCEGLLRREAELRREADGGALKRLTDERAALAARAAAETDEATRRSLEGAVAALDQQLRQRDLLKVAANRLEAEHTRLLYTLEGLASQFVRLRTAGAEASLAPRAEVEAGVQQLGAEIDAIADALDEVSRDAPPMQPQRVR